MIVCHCAVVSSGDITAALDAGARSVSEVCRRTGAAQSCGTCIFSVKQPPAITAARTVGVVPEVEYAAS